MKIFPSLYALVISLMVLISCKKDEPAPVDPRDKFVGTWSGTFNATLNCPGEPATSNSGNQKFKIEKESNNKIKITDSECTSCPILYATVKDNTFTTETITDTESSDGVLVTSTFKSGVMSLNGSSLSGSIPLEVSISNTLCTGNVQYNLAKQ